MSYMMCRRSLWLADVSFHAIRVKRGTAVNDTANCAQWGRTMQKKPGS